MKTKECKNCGKHYESERVTSKFCSDSCKTQAFRKRKEQLQLEIEQKKKEKDREEAEKIDQEKKKAISDARKFQQQARLEQKALLEREVKEIERISLEEQQEKIRSNELARIENEEQERKAEAQRKAQDYEWKARIKELNNRRKQREQDTRRAKRLLIGAGVYYLLDQVLRKK